MISANITASLYLVTGILFIMALRGLSSPETSRTGNFLGILGMGLAVIVTLLSLGDINQIKENIFYILIPIIIGGLVGGIIAFRVSMTAMPQLVAGFHSLVGLSAVLVGIVAFYNPASFGIGQVGNIKILSLVEMSLGVAIGAITFSGSCIAFLKLQGLMSGNPITFKGQHLINLFIGLLIIFLIFSFTKLQSENLFWAIIIISTLIGFLIIIPIGGADMPVVVSMLNSYSGWAAAGIGFTLENIALIITGALVGSSGAILSY
ncbi:MAG: NAD synthetase, partial [Candidatus Fonsibacter ubiquis]|nr:NAD synthetase [Candidatus Fonsibacter ubiquis]